MFTSGYAIEIGDEEYLILGGRAGSGFLRSTQIFRAGVLTDGPTLPQEDRYGIGTVKFNETHAFVGENFVEFACECKVVVRNSFSMYRFF